MTNTPPPSPSAAPQSINRSGQWSVSFLWHWLKGIIYKRHSIFHNLTTQKLGNLLRAITGYLGKKQVLTCYPPVLKIDLSPLCNLHCPVCVHATPTSSSHLLAQQYFDPSHMMPVEEFRKIIDEVKGKTQTIYLYLMGEPFMHPQLCEMSRYASDAGLNVLVSSHFSFRFPDKKIAEIAHSGITHLELSIDGATQETYEKNRAGGRLDWVLDNLQRLAAYKRKHGLVYPRIEVQCLDFDHNRHEVPLLKSMVTAMGIDMFTHETGDVGSWAELAAENFNITGYKPDLPAPACHWPFAAMVIKYNGDAIPCCLFNMGKLFTKDGGNALTLGNVFRDGVMKTWNGKPYQDIRRYVSRPSCIKDDPSLQKSFCYGCPQVSVGTFKEIIVSDGVHYNIRTNQ